MSGFRLFVSGSTEIFESDKNELYRYSVYTGMHSFRVPTGSCFYYLVGSQLHRVNGGIDVVSKTFGVLVFGYNPPSASCEIRYGQGGDLPYINGCSTSQIFPPIRAGDPTAQLLYMPRKLKEQEHHVHPTARVVLVLKGSGVAVFGNPQNNETAQLNVADVVIIDRMVQHHFEAGEGGLVVLPVHIFSSVQGVEEIHPMKLGTHKV